jgi:hypothetical protein
MYVAGSNVFPVSYELNVYIIFGKNNFVVPLLLH